MFSDDELVDILAGNVMNIDKMIPSIDYAFNVKVIFIEVSSPAKISSTFNKLMGFNDDLYPEKGSSLIDGNYLVTPNGALFFPIQLGKNADSEWDVFFSEASVKLEIRTAKIIENMILEVSDGTQFTLDECKKESHNL